jgi:Mg2+-importing ATPase
MSAARWMSWIAGFAALAAVIFVAIHVSEERAFVRIARGAEPWWLLVAAGLQAGTYLAQGETWLVVTRAARVSVPRSVTFKLSLAKLFVDQALPSGGISGTVVVARALEQRGVSRPVVMATVVVDTVAYYIAYVPILALALLITIVEGHASALIFVAALLFVIFSAVLTAIVLVFSGRTRAGPRWLRHVPPLERALSLLQAADPRLARNAGILLRSGFFQLAIILLDAATIWFLILSLGRVASPTGVFASFGISTLMRTFGILPGGLGTFEAASVVTLQLAGVPIAVALAATLLFRGLSFWFPMLPGLVFSRGARKGT